MVENLPFAFPVPIFGVRCFVVPQIRHKFATFSLLQSSSTARYVPVPGMYLECIRIREFKCNEKQRRRRLSFRLTNNMKCETESVQVRFTFALGLLYFVNGFLKSAIMSQCGSHSTWY